MPSAALEHNERALAVLTTVHTAIWLLVEAAMVYLIAAGLRGRTDRRSGVAAVIVAAESAVFLANGAHCPLTALATRLGAESGSVTDIYLPRWLAHDLPAIHVPLVLLAIYLHARNIRHGQRTATPDRLH
ncbi:MAG: hypothetical protein ACRDX9_11385 [Acidimicrobiia bacterium]